MSRKLTDEEQELWLRLSQSVRPLGKRQARTASAGKETSPAKPAAQKKATASHQPPRATPQPPMKAAPALAPLEEKTRRRLARGLVEIDARIDLHGMHQERAFAALQVFLRRAQGHGHSVVLVVTGKGNAGEGRGVLRRVVPQWLARPDFRHLVVGFNEAGPRHGGSGALYVRIRRRREERRPERSDRSES